MARHSKRTTGLVVGAALVLSCAVATAGAATTRARGNTIRLAAVQTSFTPVPAITKSSPPRIGGRMIFENALYNVGAQFGKPAGAKVGSADLVCTFVSRQYMDCTISARIPSGQLFLSGSVTKGAHQNRYAVTGGVGAYAGATGSATGRDLDQRKTLVTIDLGV
jgi:hypothetical protein